MTRESSRTLTRTRNTTRSRTPAARREATAEEAAIESEPAEFDEIDSCASDDDSNSSGSRSSSSLADAEADTDTESEVEKDPDAAQWRGLRRGRTARPTKIGKRERSTSRSARPQQRNAATAARVKALNRTVRVTGQLTELPLVPSLFARHVEQLPSEIIRVGDFRTVTDLVSSKLPERLFRRHTKISVTNAKVTIALKEELVRIRGPLHITAEYSVTPLWQFVFLVLAVATVAFVSTVFAGMALAIQQLAAAVLKVGESIAASILKMGASIAASIFKMGTSIAASVLEMGESITGVIQSIVIVAVQVGIVYMLVKTLVSMLGQPSTVYHQPSTKHPQSSSQQLLLPTHWRAQVPHAHLRHWSRRIEDIRNCGNRAGHQRELAFP